VVETVNGNYRIYTKADRYIFQVGVDPASPAHTASGTAWFQFYAQQPRRQESHLPSVGKRADAGLALGHVR